KSKADAWRKIVFTCNIVAVITYAVLDCQSMVHRPLVLEVSKKLVLFAREFATADKVELLASCPVSSQDAHRVARVVSIVRNVAHSSAHLHEVFAGEIPGTGTVDLKCVISLASSRLTVEGVSRVYIRRKIHRGIARTGEDIGVELLDAERRFQD